MGSQVVGIVLGLGGGLPLGKEGPFVHIACCLCTLMLRTLPCFASIRRSKPLRLQMLAVGCAVGVGATFGAPIGGVLFSIEVTAQYFLVKLYWRCFLASVCGAITSRWLFAVYHAKKGEGDVDELASMLHTDSEIGVRFTPTRAPPATRHPPPATRHPDELIAPLS